MTGMASILGEEKSGVRLTVRGAVMGSRLSPAYSVWVTVVLSMVSLLAAVDRNILSLLLVPIKKSLGASDAAMGALTGAAFAFVYATTALPMARIADRSNRRNFMVLALAFWSAMTAVCGLATGYVQLLLARIGVAAGESANTPATMSFIGDLYPANKRGGAIGILTIGSALGFSLGAILAGVLNDRFGWHVAMMAVGAPGLIVALLMWLTVPEPPRGAHDGPAAHSPDAVSVWRSLKRIASIRTAVPLLGGLIFLNVSFMAWLNWLPAFLMRVHHLSTTQMSGVFGLVVGVGGVISNVFAGFISDRLARRGARWRMYYCVAMVLLSIPLIIGALLSPAIGPAIACMCLYSLGAGGLTTVTSAATLSISPANMRAFMAALFGLAVAILGAGAGPWIIGILNDALKGAFGDQAIRYTLLMAPVSLALAGAMFFWASRTIELDALEAPVDGQPVSRV
jgi:predicted MFS family arabinose efflux permease